MEPTRVRTPVGTKRSISSEMSKPHNSASGSYPSKARAKRPFRSPHRARACRRERPSARESASRGKREGRWWKEDWSKDRLMRARNSGVSRGVSSRDTSASSSRH